MHRFIFQCNNITLSKQNSQKFPQTAFNKIESRHTIIISFNVSRYIIKCTYIYKIHKTKRIHKSSQRASPNTLNHHRIHSSSPDMLRAGHQVSPVDLYLRPPPWRKNMECYVPRVGPITQILAGARIHGACCEEEKSRPPSQVNRIEEERGCARIKHRDFSLAVKIIVQFVTREERGEGFVLRAILLCIKHQSRLNSHFIKFWNVFF